MIYLSNDEGKGLKSPILLCNNRFIFGSDTQEEPQAVMNRYGDEHKCSVLFNLCQAMCMLEMNLKTQGVLKTVRNLEHAKPNHIRLSTSNIASFIACQYVNPSF